jgi:predicted phage baseplate assembly protein
MNCCSACGEHACACGCGARAGTPVRLYNRPGLGSLAYRVGTYADFSATMRAGLSDAAYPALAGWRTRELDDPSMALLDAWAVGADVLSFYHERIANEGYLRTATERRSVLELARLVDYRLRPGVAASVYLSYTVEDASPPVTLPAGSRAQSIPAPGEQMQTFETADPLDARNAWNALRPRLTRPQDISLDTVAGLGELWIASDSTQLKAQDRLLFLFGDPVTGIPAIRLVRSVEVPPGSKRSRVLLQPIDTVTVKLVVAMNRAFAAASGPDFMAWVDRVDEERRDLLRGAERESSFEGFLKVLDAQPEADASPVFRDFVTAAKAAFAGSGTPSRPASGFAALFGALKAPPTLQPANSLRLSRSIASAMSVASDTHPQLLLNFESRIGDSFYRAWASVRHGVVSPTLTGVFAMRLTAPMFGYNAPRPMVLIPNPSSSAPVRAAMPFVSVPGPDWTSVEVPDQLQLDNAYDAISAGSYLLIQQAGALPKVARIKSVQVHPRSDYGMSGKTTVIALVNPDPDHPIWDVSQSGDIAVLRSTQVYAQSEVLPLADLDITDPLGDVALATATPGISGDNPTRLTLDGTVDGLKAGRWLIVEGQRTDVPGTDAVIAAELVMLAAVEQAADALLPGDTVHSTLVFANQGLAYSYKRDTVSVYANVVKATNGETRYEVLGSGNGATTMQAFVLKQAPLTYVSAPTVDGTQSSLAVRVNDLLWHESRNLAFIGPTDRGFVTRTDDDGKTSVLFGDGVHGARPATGIENVKAVYRNGIGMSGNVKAHQVSLLATKPLGVKQVINPLRASGGADPESRDQARGNVPLAVLALDRLVSVPDYADFARTFGGVGKAAAVKLGSQVRVTIAGAADSPIDTTSDLYRNLLEALGKYGDPALPVGVDVRELLALTLSANVGLAPDYAWESTEPVIRAALLDAFGFERRALARNIYLSEIVACIQAVRGVAWVDVDAFASFDEATVLADLDGTGDGKEDRNELSRAPAANFPSGVPQRVQALPARIDVDGTVRAAQLACFLPDVPDTLLLQEAAP